MALMLGSPPAGAAGSEESLIVAARDGDDRAFEALYARYRDRILAFIGSRVADRGRAEDVAQEVFLSALRRMRSSDQAIVFKPWIYEIAKNACIDEHRRMLRSREVPLDGDADGTTARRPLLSLAPTPPAVLESKLQLQDLRGAFGGLSEHHHRLLVMREFEGLSYDEIGEQLGMSRQMVESALFRARRKLGVEYEELSTGRRCQQVQAAIDDGRIRAVRSMGIRERRQLARHLAHCQACRAQAQLAGVPEPLVARRGIGARIAAWLPFPFWAWRRTASGSHAATSAGLAGGPTVSAALTGAAAAVATLVIAGAGPSGAVTQPSRLAHPAAAYTHATTPSTPSGTQRRQLSPAAAASPQSRPRAQAQRGGLRHHAAGTASQPAASGAGPAAASTAAPARTGKPSPAAGSVVRTVTGAVPTTVAHVLSGARQAISQVVKGPVQSTVHHLAQTVSHPTLPVQAPSVTVHTVPTNSGHANGAPLLHKLADAASLS